ncbi:MAG: serine hydrolase [Acidimicrobiales bacterium]
MPARAASPGGAVDAHGSPHRRCSPVARAPAALRRAGRQGAVGLRLADQPAPDDQRWRRGVEDVLWDTDVMDASIPAANGFFDARSLAKVYAVLAGDGTPGGPGAIDGVRLLSPGTVDRVGRIQTWRRDLVLVVPMRWRLGYHLVGTTRGVVHEGFGHFGFGGSGAWCDPSRGLAVAMVCNRGIGTPVGDLRLFQLGASVMDAVGARSRRAGLADAA